MSILFISLNIYFYKQL